MSEMRRCCANETGTLTLQSVLGGGSRRDIVCFVDDKDVECPWIGDPWRQYVLEQSKSLATFHPIHRGDEAGERRPGIDMDSAFATEELDVIRINDTKLETEFLLHFGLPLHLQRGRAYDKDGSRAMADQEFLNDQPCFDGLSKPDVVGDEQVDAGHVDSADQWVELVILDGDAAAKRGLQERAVGVRNRPPPDRIKKCLQPVCRIPTCDGRQSRLFENSCPRFQLPNDL